MYLKIICIQKCFVQISGASRGFYSVSLHEGYFSLRTLAVRIVSWLTLCLYQRSCCRILSKIMGWLFGVLYCMNRSKQHFIMVFNKAVRLHLEKLMNAFATNPYLLKIIFVHLFYGSWERILSQKVIVWVEFL